jgi:hypothetical protein
LAVHCALTRRAAGEILAGVKRTVLGLVLALLVAAPAAALVPPWYHFHSKLRAAFEGPALKVLELEQQDGRWIAPIVLVGPTADDVADSLATVLNRSFLNGTVAIEVRYPDGRRLPLARRRPSDTGQATARRTFATALTGNPHVSGVFEHNGGVLIELKPELLQFYADDINDRRGLAHLNPAAVFGEFLDFSPFTSTRIWYSFSPR